MNLKPEQWLMIVIIVAFFVALYLWTRHKGHALDRNSHHAPGE